MCFLGVVPDRSEDCPLANPKVDGDEVGWFAFCFEFEAEPRDGFVEVFV